MERLSAIETRHLVIGYTLRGGARRVVHPRLNVRLYPGELTCLLGRNGAGKSTLLKTLCRLIPPLDGEIRIEGRRIGDYSPAGLSAKVGVVLTERTLSGGLSVYDLVSLGRYPHTGFFGTLKETDHAAIRAALETVGIADKAERSLAELSDGERQKAFIAKALAQECPIILLDEPTAFLDVTSRLETFVTLRRLAREKSKAILLSTHDLDTALQLADRLWLLPAVNADGTAEALRSGTPGELVANGSLAHFFDSETIVFDPASRRLISRSGK